MDQLRAYERNSPHDGCTDAQSPVRILIEAEDLPRKRHPQRAQKQKAATDPRQLTRILVSSKQERLNQMQAHDADHEDRPPVVDRTKEPPQELLIVQILEAGPGLACRRHVDESQTSARHDLQNETQERAATEHIKPAIGAGRDFV